MQAMMATTCLFHNHTRLLGSNGQIPPRTPTPHRNANALQPNVVETDGAQSSGLNETAVENMLRSVSDLIKTTEGSNTSGLLLLSLAAWTGRVMN